MWLAEVMGRRVLGRVQVGTLTALLLCAGCSGDDDPLTTTTTDQVGNTVVVTHTAAPTEAPDAVDGGPTTASPDPVPTTLPVPGDGDAAPTTRPPAGDAGSTTAAPQHTVLTRVSLQVPGGWTVQDLGEAAAADPVPGAVAPHRWCLAPPYGVPEVDGCAGVLVAVGGDWLPGAAGQPYAEEQVDGWRWGTEPLLCPFDPEADPEAEEPNLVVSDAEGTPLTTADTEVNGMTTHYETWRVRCTTTEDVFTPQLWHIPELNVLVKDYFGQADTGSVLESLGGA